MRSRRQIKKRGSKNARNARQRKLEILNAMLEKKVLERTDELRRANEKLVQLARHDALTGLANRLYANERLREEFLRMKRTGCCYSVLMIDVDHFKLYNDHYGHIAGDDCLKAISRTLAAALPRSTDLMARFGGEEFVCVLTCTGQQGAANVAEKLRQSVLALGIPHARSEISPTVTVSIGTATARPSINELHPENLLHAADTQLYLAKSSGRNRVMSVLCQPSPID